MKKAYIFPGQGSQYPGMAKALYEKDPTARELLEKANEILGFRITDIMFEGTADDLKQTKVTQPAIYLHSTVLARCLSSFTPDMVAGHSLGEFSALTAAGAITFEDGLRLVSIRAQAMQKACEKVPGTMAAIIDMRRYTGYSSRRKLQLRRTDCHIRRKGCCRSRLLKNERGRSKARTGASGRRSIPFSAYGTGQSRTGGRNRKDTVPPAHMPGISECHCKSVHRPRDNQSQPPGPADFPCKVDTEYEEYAVRWSRPFHRARPRQSAAGTPGENSDKRYSHRRLSGTIGFLRQDLYFSYRFTHILTNFS